MILLILKASIIATYVTAADSILLLNILIDIFVESVWSVIMISWHTL